MGEKTAAIVKVKLIIDDNAKAMASHVAAGFKSVGGFVKTHAGTVKDATMSFAGSSKNALAIVGKGFAMAGAAAAAAGGGIYELAEKSVDAYGESAKQVRELAGTLTMIDQNGNSFERLKGYAADLKDNLEELAIQAGTTDEAMVETFNDIIERGGKSVDEAKELAGQMAYAGRAFGGGQEALSAGFEQIQMGMVRAKNPIVQIIASTHQLKGSAKTVAKEMQKMSLEKQMALAEKAIGKMSDKMKDVPMTMGQMKKSMGVAWQNLFETAGEPISKAMGPAFAKVREMFMDARGPLQAAAHEFGETMAKVVGLVVPIMDALGVKLKANWGDIQNGIGGLVSEAKETIDFLSKNREATAKSIAGAAAALIKATDYLLGGAIATAKVLTGGAKLIAKYSDPEGYQGMVQDEQMEKLRATVNNTPGIARPGSSSAIDAQKVMSDQLIASGMEAALAFTKSADSYNAAALDHNAKMAEVAKFRDGAIYADTDSFVKAWKIADASNDEGVKEYVANFLAANRELVKNIGEKGPEILGSGFDNLTKKLTEMHSTIGDELSKAAQPKLGKTEITQNFNGGIQIKQDFRDQDPDRIMTVMRDDLARAGSSRIQSTFASPFGF